MDRREPVDCSPYGHEESDTTESALAHGQAYHALDSTYIANTGYLFESFIVYQRLKTKGRFETENPIASWIEVEGEDVDGEGEFRRTPRKESNRKMASHAQQISLRLSPFLTTLSLLFHSKSYFLK